MLVGELQAKLTMDSTAFSRGLTSAQGEVDRFADKVRHTGEKMKAIGRTMALGITLPVIALVGKTINDLGQIDALAAQTEAAIKSTGGAAGVTKKHIINYANSIEKLTGVEMESVQAGQNLLLTFTNIKNGVGKGNDIFDQATKSVVDMSKALGQDTASSAIQLGKALNDPIRGVTALQRVGVSFTQGQKDQIKAMVEAGDVMGAQKLILKELNTEFGGSAEAWGNTLPGQIAKAKNAFGDIAEVLVSALIPHIKTLARWIVDLKDRFDKLSPKARKIVGILIAITAAAGPLLWILGGIATALTAISWPVLLITLAIAALVAGLIYAYRNWEWFREIVDNVAAFLKNKAWPAIQEFAKNVAAMWEPFKAKTAEIVDYIGPKLLGFWETLKSTWERLNGPAKVLVATLGLLGLALMSPALAIAALVAGFIWAYAKVEWFREAVNGVIEWFKNDFAPAMGRVWETIKPYIESFIAWLNKNVVPMLKAFMDMVIALFNVLGPLIGGILLVAFKILKNIWDLWGDDIIQILKGVWTIIEGVLRGAFKVLKGIFQVITGILTGDWDMVWKGIKNIFAGFWDAIFGIVKGAFQILKGLFSGIFDFIQAIWNRIYDVGRVIWDKIWQAISWFVQSMATGIQMWLDIIKEVWNRVWENIKTVVTFIWDSIKTTVLTAFDAVKTGIETTLNTLKTIWDTAWQGMKTAIGWVIDKAQAFWDKIVSLKDTIGDMVGKIKDAVTKPFNAIKDAIQDVIDKIKEFIKKIGDAAKAVKDKMPGKGGLPFKDAPGIGRLIPGAVGTSFSAFQPVKVGERGPEWLLPKQPGEIISNNRLRNIMNGMALRGGAVGQGSTTIVIVQSDREAQDYVPGYARNEYDSAQFLYGRSA